MFCIHFVHGVGLHIAEKLTYYLNLNVMWADLWPADQVFYLVDLYIIYCMYFSLFPMPPAKDSWYLCGTLVCRGCVTSICPSSCCPCPLLLYWCRSALSSSSLLLSQRYNQYDYQVLLSSLNWNRSEITWLYYVLWILEIFDRNIDI